MKGMATDYSRWPVRLESLYLQKEQVGSTLNFEVNSDGAWQHYCGILLTYCVSRTVARVQWVNDQLTIYVHNEQIHINVHYNVYWNCQVITLEDTSRRLTQMKLALRTSSSGGAPGSPPAAVRLFYPSCQQPGLRWRNHHPLEPRKLSLACNRCYLQSHLDWQSNCSGHLGWGQQRRRWSQMGSRWMACWGMTYQIRQGTKRSCLSPASPSPLPSSPANMMHSHIQPEWPYTIQLCLEGLYDTTTMDPLKSRVHDSPIASIWNNPKCPIQHIQASNSINKITHLCS